MKLKIERTQPEGLRIELAYDAAKKPLVLNLDRLQTDGLIQLLAAAQKAESFRMELV